jgi:hypothetical protein
MYGILDDNDKLIAKFAAPTSYYTNTNTDGILESLSLRRYFYIDTAQRWAIRSNLEPLGSTANELFTHVVIKGSEKVLKVRMPQQYGVVQKRTGSKNTIKVDIGISKSNLININYSGIIPKGTFIAFNNHSKVYITLQDYDGSGTSLEIYPPLRKTVSGQQMYHRDDVILYCYYSTDAIKGMSFSDGILMDLGEITLLEALNFEITSEAIIEEPFISSTVYPLFGKDSHLLNIPTIVDSVEIDIPVEELNYFCQLISGDLITTTTYVVYYHDPIGLTPEELDYSCELLDGDLIVTTTYQIYDRGEEEIDYNCLLIDGDLIVTTTYVVHEQGLFDDDLDVMSTLIDGELISV